MSGSMQDPRHSRALPCNPDDGSGLRYPAPAFGSAPKAGPMVDSGSETGSDSGFKSGVGIAPDSATSDRVVILLAVFNGADPLPAQLDSIAGQTHRSWCVLASDDRSVDGSRTVLADFAAQGHALTCLDGPGQGGAAGNFMSLIRRARDHAAPGDWIAFCDQDDVWLPDRLARGRTALRAVGASVGDGVGASDGARDKAGENAQTRTGTGRAAETRAGPKSGPGAEAGAIPDTNAPAEGRTDTQADRPALFCSRTWITDDTFEPRRLSAPRPRPPGFRNALVQNVVSGNTILLNPAGARLICDAAHEAGVVVVHDWWIYQIVSGAGGIIVHDDAPTLLYRQHSDNLIGANDTFAAQIKRLRQMLRGDFRDWNDINIAALMASAHRLTPQNRTLLEAFDAARRKGLIGRLTGFARLGLYRQSVLSHAGLWLSILLGRV